MAGMGWCWVRIARLSLQGLYTSCEENIHQMNFCCSYKSFISAPVSALKKEMSIRGKEKTVAEAFFFFFYYNGSLRKMKSGRLDVVLHSVVFHQLSATLWLQNFCGGRMLFILSFYPFYWSNFVPLSRPLHFGTLLSFDHHRPPKTKQNKTTKPTKTNTQKKKTKQKQTTT